MDSSFRAVVVADVGLKFRPSRWTEHISSIAVKKVPFFVASGQILSCMVLWLKTMNTVEMEIVSPVHVVRGGHLRDDDVEGEGERHHCV
jgi:hypothetical protein